MPKPVTPGPPQTVTPRPVGKQQTLPDWWGIVNASGPTGNTFNYGDVRFPLSKAVAPEDYLPLVYGACRVGGSSLQFGPVSGDELRHGWGVIAWCQGEIQSIDSILCNGIALPAPYTTALWQFGYANYVGAAGQYLQDNSSDIFCPYPRTHGGSGSSGPYDVSGLAGVSYTKFDILFLGTYPPSTGWWGTLPNVALGNAIEWAADVHGLKIWDPRLSGGAGGTAYSRNPALIVRDLYSRIAGLSSSGIDDASFTVAANACDAAGFTCDVVFAARISLRDALAVVLQTCNGTVIDVGGKVGLNVEVLNASAPVATFSEEAGDVWDLHYEWLAARDRPTRVRVTFKNAANNYADDATPDLDDPGIALGTIPVRELVVNVPGINTLAAAVILRDYFYNSRAVTFRVRGTMSYRGVLRQQGEKIHLDTLSGLSMDSVIEQIGRDQSGFFSFVVKPYLSSVFSSGAVTQDPPIIDPPLPNPWTTPPDVTLDLTGPWPVVGDANVRVTDAGAQTTRTVILPRVDYSLPNYVWAKRLRIRTGAHGDTWATMDPTTEREIPLTGNMIPMHSGTADWSLFADTVEQEVTVAHFNPNGTPDYSVVNGGDWAVAIKVENTMGLLSAGVTRDGGGAYMSAGTPYDGGAVVVAKPLVLVEDTLPSVSAGGQTIIAMDSADHAVKASVNGAAYAPIGSGGGGGGGAAIANRVPMTPGSPQTVSAANSSPVDITGATTSFTPTETGNHLAIFAFDVAALSTAGTTEQFVGILCVNGVAQPPGGNDVHCVFYGDSTVGARACISNTVVLSLTAGVAVTIKLQAYINSASPTNTYDVYPTHTGFSIVAPATVTGSTTANPFLSRNDFDGDGSTVAFVLTAAPATSGIVAVTLNGALQPVAAWSLSGATVTMTAAPLTGDVLSVVYYTIGPSGMTHTQEDFTGAGGTDFTLAHAPTAVLMVALGGVIQLATAWSIVSSTTLRFASAVTSGDAVSITYTY